MKENEREVHPASYPELEIQSPARQNVHPRVHEEDRDIELGSKAHMAAPSRLSAPMTPWGSSTSTRTRTAKAMTSLYEGFTNAAETSVAIPTARAPSIAP